MCQHSMGNSQSITPSKTNELPALDHAPQLPPELYVFLKRRQQNVVLLLQLGELTAPFQEAAAVTSSA